MKNKLPKEFKEKWVAALRSGEYKQGEAYLKNNAGQYCCLGVACMVAYNGIPPNLLGEEWIDHSFKLVPDILRGDGNNDLVNDLSNMNDGGLSIPKLSFHEIADYIEQHL